jgi:hypothetical protein
LSACGTMPALLSPWGQGSYTEQHDIAT